MIVGGLDIGTTGCKIALYNDKADLLAVYYREYSAIHKNGQHEIDFNDVKANVLSILKTATANYKIDAIGVTSFGETFAMLDENDCILAPSMLYTDPRGEKECEYLCELFGKEYLTLTTGAKPHPMYSISKILWYKNNEPSLFSRCKKILLGEDFIVYTLTGNAQIDYSLAARTGAFDIEKRCWILQMFKALDIDVSLMSTPVAAGSIAGKLNTQLKTELEIDYDITIINGCHDQVAAMIGAGISDTDKAMDGTGTVECIPVVLDKKPDDIQFYEYGYSVVPYINGKYACYALSYTSGAALKWFRDNFAELEYIKAEKSGENVYANLDKKADKKPTGILVLPHFAGAATPYMDNRAKAAFLGITLETNKYDIYKALMEGTSYEMLLNFNTMKAFTGEIKEIRATGGGASSDLWLQIKADILNTAITSIDCKEVGAAGTVILAGTALNVFDNPDFAAAKMAKVRKVFNPNYENREIYAKLYKKYENLYAAIKNL